MRDAVHSGAMTRAWRCGRYIAEVPPAVFLRSATEPKMQEFDAMIRRKRDDVLRIDVRGLHPWKFPDRMEVH